MEMMLREIKLEYTPAKKELELVSSPALVYERLKSMAQDTRELTVALYLDCALKCLGMRLTGIGGSTMSYLNIRDVVQTALLTNCALVVIAHNHPSGQLKFSPADIEVTQRLREVLGMMEILLCDHVLVTQDGYLSMREEGMLGPACDRYVDPEEFAKMEEKVKLGV